MSTLLPSVSPKILVVDDTHANLIAMRRLLANSGAEVIEAANGNEALALCLDHRFALILLDVNMPEMDGFEVASLLGEIELSRETPIIFVTAAYSDDLNKLRGYHSGAVDYIAKPINDVILQSKVRIFLDLYQARAELQIALDELSERNQQLTDEVAERERAEALVRHQASHDTLTGLPNRMLFHDRLQHAIQRSQREGSTFALACIDIDGFKSVNDIHGHPAGDALLRMIGARLVTHRRGNDTVARMGGDEFALILEGVTDAQIAFQLGSAVCVALAEPYLLTVNGLQLQLHVGASIGIAQYVRNEGDGDANANANADEQLIQAADRAMYEAKRNGKNQCVIGDYRGTSP